MSLPTDSARWNLVKSLFDEAQQRPEFQREAWLREQDLAPEVREELLSLLAHSTGGLEAAPGFLEQPAATPRELGQSGWPGMRCGSWELLEPIGSGGMGDVFRARRADGAYEGQAAVKLLKRGMDSASVLARFALEQQTLARLEHPHIARLFDAGLSELGLPYFVMELVQGRPLDQACEGLDLEQRLQLFLQLADAVAYAHRNLLVHRDLKPGNVLVNEQSQVKLLDFGIAKALDSLPDAPHATHQAARPFTPLYASPEQVRGEPVSTATDVYSLGVLLYQMLTGQRPYARGVTAPAEAARAVLEDQPTRPSSLGPPASGQSDEDNRWLATRQRLLGDLDNILLKALEKDAARRYVSVDSFAADIRAHLSGYPVSAHAPSHRYLVGKFIARNRVVVGFAGLAALALIAGTGVASWQAHEAALARDASQANLQRIRSITREVVLRYGDAVTHLPGGLRVKEALLKDLLKHLGQLSAEAGGDPAWLADLAGVYARLAEIEGDDTGASLNKGEEARDYARRAIALAEQVWPQQRADAGFVGWYVQALQVQALGLRADKRPDESVRVMEQALARLDEAATQVPAAQQRALQLDRAAALLRMGQFYDTQTVASLNQPETALQWFSRSEALLDQLAADGKDLQWRQVRASLHGARALTQARLNGIAAARSDAEQAVAERQAAAELAPANTAVVDGLITEATNLGVILLRQPDATAALAATRIAWVQCERLARENGPGNEWEDALPRVALHHGRALVETGHFTEALPVVKTALAGLAGRAAKQPGPHLQRMQAWQGLFLARALHGTAQPQQALELVRQSLLTLTPLAQADKARDALLNLGEAQWLMSQWEPVQRSQWRAQARLSYEKAHALLALAGDHALRLQELGGRP